MKLSKPKPKPLPEWLQAIESHLAAIQREIYPKYPKIKSIDANSHFAVKSANHGV